jgi:WD40 repeat protein
MVELWEHRQGRAILLSAYAATGGVRGAVGRLAEAAFGRLTETQKGIARSIFLRLAAGEGDVVVRRRIPLVDFDVDTNADVGATLRVLTDARLLTIDEGTVEVAHEALLREWPRLADWLEEDREGRRLRAHLADTAREWDSRGRDPGELYRGARLASTLDWTTEHTLELNATERRFVAESRAASEAEVVRERRVNRRLRVLLGAAGIALVAAVGAGGYALIQQREAEAAAADADSQRAVAETQRRAAFDAADAADAQRLGAQALVAKDLDLSLLLARQGLALDDSPATRSNLLAALNRSPGAIGIWRPLPGRLLQIFATPDGATLAVNNNNGQTAVIDARTSKTRFIYDWQPGDQFVVLPGDNGTLAVIRDEPRRVALLDVADGTERGEIVFPGQFGGISAAPDVSSISATAQDGSSLTIWNSNSLEPIATLSPPAGTTFLDVWQFEEHTVMAVLHDGALPDPVDAAFEQPATLAWYEPGATAPKVTIPVANAATSFAVSPDRRHAAVANDPEEGGVALYDLSSGEKRVVGGRHSARVQGLAFSPDGRLLGSGGDDRVLIIWDVSTGDLRETFSGHNGRLFAAAFSEIDGRLTAYTSSLDGSLIGWDVSGERRLGRPFDAGSGNEFEFVDDFPFFEATPTFALSPDGSLLAVTQSGSVVIRDAATHDLVRELPVGGWGAATDVAWSLDGTRLAVAGSGDAILQLWDPSTWTKVGGPLAGPAPRREAGPAEIDPNDPGEDRERANLARTVAFSADGRTVVAGAEDGQVWTWNAMTGEPTGDPIGVGWPIYDVAIDPTGTLIAAAFNVFPSPEGPNAGKALVVNLSDRRVLYTVSVDDDYGRAGAVAFSPDGRTLATGGGTGDVRFWDAQTGAEVGRRFLAAAGWVFSIAWHPTEPVVVTASTDGTIRLVDVERRAQSGLLPGLDNQPANAAFTPDGGGVIVVYSTGQGFDWTVDPDDWESQACTVAGRTLTEEEWQLYLPDRPYEPACP